MTENKVENINNSSGMNEQCLKVFSARLRYLMNKRGLSITQMAERCGVAVSTFSKYYHGKSDPKLSVIMVAAFELGVSVNDLCDLDWMKLMSWKNRMYSWERP